MTVSYFTVRLTVPHMLYIQTDTDHTALSNLPADLLELTDLIIEVINTPLVLQAELREQICTQLSLQ